MQNSNFKIALLLASLLLIFFASTCKKDDVTPIEPYLEVNIEQVPLTNLSAYGFFKGDMKDLTPSRGVISYNLTSTLFSDYTAKERFIYLPEGKTMNFQGDFDVLDFPEGAIIIKNFLYYVDERDESLGRTIIETRLLVKKSIGWKPYTYKWNDEQTEAVRLITGGIASGATILANGETKVIDRYVIPRELDCRTCHNLNEEMTPIGPKPSNLNRPMDADPSQNQLEDWTDKGLLIGANSTVSQIPDYHEEGLDPVIRGNAYLDANCAFCHRQGGTASANSLYINWDFDGSDLNRGHYKIPTNFNAPGLQYDIVPGNPDESILFYRMTQTEAPAIMPQIGRSVNHVEGIEIIRAFILNLE